MLDYDRIEKAMTYLADRVDEQPSLEEVAAHVHLSPFHFQRLFCRWAGTTPKRFLQVLTIEHGKMLLEGSRSLLDVSHSIGLSGSSRLHDHFVQLEAMTPGEHKSRGKGVRVEYGVHATPFGRMLVAVTKRGVCRASFVELDGIDEALAELRRVLPLSSLARSQASARRVIDAMLDRDMTSREGPLSLHVSGTNFQIAIWRALLRIPAGAVASYSQLAASAGYPRASRAVANAVAANPVAFVIPCHRVIRRSGALGGYRWGETRKRLMQAWERARADAALTPRG